jgi:hypothetical protein
MSTPMVTGLKKSRYPAVSATTQYGFVSGSGQAFQQLDRAVLEDRMQGFLLALIALAYDTQSRGGAAVLTLTRWVFWTRPLVLEGSMSDEVYSQYLFLLQDIMGNVAERGDDFGFQSFVWENVFQALSQMYGARILPEWLVFLREHVVLAGIAVATDNLPDFLYQLFGVLPAVGNSEHHLLGALHWGEIFERYIRTSELDIDALVVPEVETSTTDLVVSSPLVEDSVSDLVLGETVDMDDSEETTDIHDAAVDDMVDLADFQEWKFVHFAACVRLMRADSVLALAETFLQLQLTSIILNSGTACQCIASILDGLLWAPAEALNVPYRFTVGACYDGMSLPWGIRAVYLGRRVGVGVSVCSKGRGAATGFFQFGPVYIFGFIETGGGRQFRLAGPFCLDGSGQGLRHYVLSMPVSGCFVGGAVISQCNGRVVGLVLSFDRGKTKLLLFTQAVIDGIWRSYSVCQKREHRRVFGYRPGEGEVSRVEYYQQLLRGWD